MTKEKQLLESAAYRLSQAIDIFNGSSGLNTGAEDKYSKMVDLCDEINEFLNAPSPAEINGVKWTLGEGFVKKVVDRYLQEEISFGKMVELMNEEIQSNK